MKALIPRVLHTAYISKPSAGVVKQMQWEVDAAKCLGLSWDCRLYSGTASESDVVYTLPVDASKGRLASFLQSRRAYFNELEALADCYDIILFRHMMYSIREAKFLSKYGYKTFTVHHTHEVNELLELLPLPFNLIFAGLEYLVGSRSIRATNGVIAVTNEIGEYEISRLGSRLGVKQQLSYPNGFKFNERKIRDSRESVPEFVFVASTFFSWHGLDLLLDDLSKDSSDCIVHLAGNIPEDLLYRCEHESRVRVHGFCDEEKLLDLYERAWCGISSLALHRKGMREACTLKTREYLESGLPVYADHFDSGLPDDFPYFMRGEVSLASMLKFVNSHRDASRYTVRESASKFLSKRTLLRNLYEKLSE